MHAHVFTVGEAQALLPTLRQRLRSALSSWRTIVSSREEVTLASKNAQWNGGSADGPRYLAAIEALGDTVRQISGLGVLVKDLESGLCDFPCVHEGRLVYLCWRLGESRIEWWHEVDAGFAGRQPLRDGLGEN
ncbi:MAG: DUF2203 domain-containing protein [Candidatus Schekmanbacteria bacterium]|nr:DUF2203 domain-containing protein [Candidatus Schekmanbacteria bacterium]